MESINQETNPLTEFLDKLLNGNLSGMKQIDIAKKCGIAPSVVNRIVNKKEISALNLYKLLNALGLLVIDGEHPSKDPLLDEALRKYKYLSEIKRRVELALERGLPEEVLYENIKSEMDTALRELRAIKKEGGGIPQDYSFG